MNLIENTQNRKYKHEHKEKLCYCCDTLQDRKEDLHIYNINGRGYGSIFDSSKFSIQLCDKCNKLISGKWFNEQPELIDGYCEDYKYEEYIESFIDTFPIENQEYVSNEYDNYQMLRQDWIDMKLGLLPDEKYEEYHMYSPREIKAYKERFTTCNYPINIVFNNNSKGCSCPFGANGLYGQNIDTNISDECYNCQAYKIREEPIKEITYEKYKLLQQSIKGIYAFEKLQKQI